MKKQTIIESTTDKPAGKSLPVKTVTDVWELLNHLDDVVVDEGSDLKRVKERVQINRQRIELIKIAVRAGALKSDQLKLTQSVQS